MKCNFKNKFLAQQQSKLNLINSFKKNFIEGNLDDLISKSELNSFLLELIKQE